jgi:hypothetical protein
LKGKVKTMDDRRGHITVSQIKEKMALEHKKWSRTFVCFLTIGFGIVTFLDCFGIEDLVAVCRANKVQLMIIFSGLLILLNTGFILGLVCSIKRGRSIVAQYESDFKIPIIDGQTPTLIMPIDGVVRINATGTRLILEDGAFDYSYKPEGAWIHTNWKSSIADVEHGKQIYVRSNGRLMVYSKEYSMKDKNTFRIIG